MSGRIRSTTGGTVAFAAALLPALALAGGNASLGLGDLRHWEDARAGAGSQVLRGLRVELETTLRKTAVVVEARSSRGDGRLHGSVVRLNTLELALGVGREARLLTDLEGWLAGGVALVALEREYTGFVDWGMEPADGSAFGPWLGAGLRFPARSTAFLGLDLHASKARVKVDHAVFEGGGLSVRASLGFRW